MRRTVQEGDVLWTPPAGDRSRQVQGFVEWLATNQGRRYRSYDELWQWSVTDLPGFWSAVWSWSDVIDHGTGGRVALSGMLDTVWFPGAGLNYAEHALRHPDDDVALLFCSEDGEPKAMNYAGLRAAVARAATGLRNLGVRSGDRVAAYMPNVPEAVVAFLATASIGAIWTCCSPDFGPGSVLDRFRQVEPTVLLAAPTYVYNGRRFDRREALQAVTSGLPSLRAVITVPGEHEMAAPEGAVTWRDFMAEDGSLAYEAVPFDHPLWIVYTSGTTGIPKSIVHTHGGVLLEHTKLLRLHLDLTPADTFLWFTTTGWVMWNILVSGLLVGATMVLYDGSPTYPRPDRLWEVADRAAVSYFGMSAAFIAAAMAGGLEPGRSHDMTSLRSVGVTGSPLSPAGFAWLYEQLGPDLFVGSISGGTDVCSAFLGCVPTLPVRAGELQRACLGVDARCFADDGKELLGEPGELVITTPMPSMPVGFWNDPDHEAYRNAYFRRYPGLWHHGDWVRQTQDRSWVVYGRSDATLNRGGVRMGTGDFYRVLEKLPVVRDAVVIDASGDSTIRGGLVLLVALSPGTTLEEAETAIIRALRDGISPRHVPDDILEVTVLPHTLNGKRMEVPIKRLFLGAPLAAVCDPHAVDDEAALLDVARIATVWRETRSVAGRSDGKVRVWNL